ncbi:putative OsmC-like protein [Paenibacillus mucilaginosus]|uniref:hypothetical protein n=1 Tax=Paenibacillus mucilaginosus TaxID=61624 RepID=UPI003D25F5BC
MEQTKITRVWENLMNNEVKTTRKVEVEISFDGDMTEDQVKELVFKALEKYADDMYLSDSESAPIKPTVIKI